MKWFGICFEQTQTLSCKQWWKIVWIEFNDFPAVRIHHIVLYAIGGMFLVENLCVR